MARYYLETYGCTANRGESHQIQRQLRDAGHHHVQTPGTADVAILNTCTVVEKTEQNMLRRASELADTTPDLIVTGCMALAQADLITDSCPTARVIHWDEVPPAVGNGECPTTTPDTRPVLDGVIGILPIARGCLSNCSYCITKHATGKITSPPIEDNVEKARALVHAGAKELRITGQDTGVYGWERGERALPELLDRICRIPGSFRVRLGMANPKGVYGTRDDLVRVFARHDELYNFVHTPVQSGSDRVLQHMRRQHTADEFRTVVDTFDARLDHWTLSTDFIVGYPTETPDDFEESMAVMDAVRPEKINITRFSKRPGTDAASLPGLGGQTKKDRSKAMTTRKLEIVGAAYEAMVGRTYENALVVEPGTGDSVKCRDHAYRLLVVPDAPAHGLSPGEFVDLTVTDHHTTYATATPA